MTNMTNMTNMNKMNNMTIFENPAFGRVRATQIDGEPWFVGKDVAEALGYSNSRKAIADHVDEEDKGVTKRDTLGGAQDLTIINESGLYSLILSSKLPTAKEFKRWVTSEVLPSIRKSGGYIAGQETLSDVELLAKALVVAQNTLRQREARIKGLEVENSQLSVENSQLSVENSALNVDKAIMQPKADYFDELVERNTLTNFRETALELGIGQKALVTFLMDKKYVYRNKNGKLMPYADKNDGLFEVKEFYNKKSNWTGTQTLITPKGRETFRLLCVDL